MSAISEKGKALSKWCPSDDYHSSYDRIFGKKEKIEVTPTLGISINIEPIKDTLFSPSVLYTIDTAVKHFGALAQLEKTREECNELAVALKDYEKHRSSDENDEYRKAAIDETADVLLTALQAAAILGSSEVADRIVFKANRLGLSFKE